MNILVLHGPNLNLLGERPGDEKGKTLELLNEQLERRAGQVGAEVRILQSNHEGELIDAIHAARQWADAIVINPAALTHTSYGLREAIAAVKKPAIEVHLTDIRRRESWRRKSVIKDVCESQILGKGFDSYLLAIDKLAGAPKPTKAARKAAANAAASDAVHPERNEAKRSEVEGSAKTLGRKQVDGDASAKTLGRAAAAVHPERKEAKRGGVEGSAKTLGRKSSQPDAAGRGGPGTDFLTRALVRQKIAERLGGKLTSSGLSTWARSKWLDVQRGAPAESGQREVLEDSLQQLVLASMPPAKLSDDELIGLMAQLDG